MPSSNATPTSASTPDQRHGDTQAGKGIVTPAGSDLAVTLARRWGIMAQAWYPMGAIAALGMLAGAGWRDYRLEEMQRDLPPKFEPTGVY